MQPSIMALSLLFCLSELVDLDTRLTTPTNTLSISTVASHSDILVNEQKSLHYLYNTYKASTSIARLASLLRQQLAQVLLFRSHFTSKSLRSL